MFPSKDIIIRIIIIRRGWMVSEPQPVVSAAGAHNDIKMKKTGLYHYVDVVFFGCS